jgi:hypothetical protein
VQENAELSEILTVQKNARALVSSSAEVTQEGEGCAECRSPYEGPSSADAGFEECTLNRRLSCRGFPIFDSMVIQQALLDSGSRYFAPVDAQPLHA